jgi:hypothetical protein
MVKAHIEVLQGIRFGSLSRPKRCSKCDLLRSVDAHHGDYEKPLDVEWLCRSCHKRLHFKLRSAGLNNPASATSDTPSASLLAEIAKRSTALINASGLCKYKLTLSPIKVLRTLSGKRFSRWDAEIRAISAAILRELARAKGGGK